MAGDPLLGPWDGPFGAPRFELIRTEEFEPAFDRAIAAAEAARRAIETDPAPAGFANVVEALERSGRALDRVGAIFFTLAGADATPGIEEIEARIAPRLARLAAATYANPALLARLEAVAEDGLSPEQARFLELLRRRCRRAGARLDAEGRARIGAIMERLAALGARFSRNLLADERGFALMLGPDDLGGLPESLRAAARAAARERGAEGWAITLSRSLIEPFLRFSERRDLRERAFRAWAARGRGGGETDNRAILAEILALRRERARLLGHESYAAWKIEPEMARTPTAARALLERVWAPARAAAEAEAAALEALMRREGATHPLEPWDWRFWAERLAAAEGRIGEEALRPHLSLERMIEAAFATAGRLFGLDFRELPDAPRHHPDARVWEARRDGAHLGLFVGDYFARPTKRSGAWCGRLRAQSRLDGEERPIVVNVMNFARAGDGPTLLTHDDARTLFHEFGHALHNLLSDVTYPSLSGTSVARDFVELPSQLFERWLDLPETLARHARHIGTGAAPPADLAARLAAAERAGQGFATVEYLASALVDLAVHEAAETDDPLALEAATLAAIAMPRAIAPRHGLAHFAHLFAGEGYAAGYYSYMWSEVMEADAFAAFEEAGDPFDAGVARRLEAEILSVGDSRDPAEAWRAFRGRPPEPGPMLARRGLDRAA